MSSSTTVRTVRRRTLRVAVAALIATAGLSLTACSGSDGGASKAASHTDANAAVGAGVSDSSGLKGNGAQADSTKSGSGNGGTSSRAGSGGGASKGDSTFESCRTDDLVISAVDSSPDENTGDVTVKMTNKGGSTCSATGFAGADLKDADGTSAPIERADNQPRVTNLQPGDTATFNISYEVDHSGDSLAQPTNLIVTPPNGTHSVSLEWPAEALKLADPGSADMKMHPVAIDD
ncbi:DUF4232 domain-containing protein [Streptomyces sp. NPDC050617]|uniref:DUF4232 domain-containing protein n=1 Tax=Streptomyces sp. NPDC050617 TaxID=3154628 RepID=UPI003418518A